MAAKSDREASGGANWGSTLGSGRWMKEEHDDFLEGLEACGRDWAAISRRFVPSRTVTQVRTHAQKYFIKMDSGQAFPEEPYESSPKPSAISSSSSSSSSFSGGRRRHQPSGSSTTGPRAFLSVPRDAVRPSRTRSGARNQAALAHQQEQQQQQRQEHQQDQEQRHEHEEEQEQERRQWHWQPPHHGSSLVCMGIDDVSRPQLLSSSSSGDDEDEMEAMGMSSPPSPSSQLPRYPAVGFPSHQHQHQHQQRAPPSAAWGAEGYQQPQVDVCGDNPFPFNAPDLAQANFPFMAGPFPAPPHEEGDPSAPATSLYDAPHLHHHQNTPARGGVDGGAGGGMPIAKWSSLSLCSGRAEMDVGDLGMDMDMDIGLDIGMGAQLLIPEGCGGGSAWMWRDRHPGVIPGGWNCC